MKEENLELPLESPKPSRRKPRAAKVLTQADRMLEAINFVMFAQKKTGKIENRFCRVVNGWIVASTEDLMIAHPIEGIVDCCPQTALLKAAVMKCGDDINVTQLNDNSISVMSGDFRAIVPCVTEDQIWLYERDEPTDSVGNSLRDAIASVYSIISTKKTDKEIYQRLLIQPQTVIATCGTIILRAYHGKHLPNGISISKEAATAVAKCKQNLINFGWSKESFTFHFENDAFIRAKRYDCSWPNINPFFEKGDGSVWNVPDNFYEALKSITPFSKNEFVHFKEGLITSDSEENEASTFAMETLHTGISAKIKILNTIKPYFYEVEKNRDRLLFKKGNVEGVAAVTFTEVLESVYE